MFINWLLRRHVSECHTDRRSDTTQQDGNELWEPEKCETVRTEDRTGGKCKNWENEFMCCAKSWIQTKIFMNFGCILALSHLVDWHWGKRYLEKLKDPDISVVQVVFTFIYANEGSYNQQYTNIHINSDICFISVHLSNFQLQHALCEAEVFLCFDFVTIFVPECWGFLLYISYLKCKTPRHLSLKFCLFLFALTLHLSTTQQSGVTSYPRYSIKWGPKQKHENICRSWTLSWGKAIIPAKYLQ